MKLKPGTPEEVGMSDQRIRYIKGLAKDWVDQGIASALVVLVARRGTIVLQEVFGRLSPDQDAPPQLNTLFPFGSASRIITITAAMVLVDDGLLGLNRPVSSYIPELTGEGTSGILVHHLLIHTSGFRDQEIGVAGHDMEGYLEKKGKSVTIPQLDSNQHPIIHKYLHATYDAPLTRTPGSTMRVDHHGIELLGEIIRRVSGKPVHDFARERICEPLGMKDTFYTVPASERNRIVKRPPDAPAAELLGNLEHNEVPWAAWSVFTSPRDMAIFGQMFLNRGRYGDVRVLSPAAVTEMTRNQVAGISAEYRDEYFSEASWGYGWNVHGHKKALGDGTLQSPQAIYQGNSGGPIVWVDPVYEIVGVYFSTALKLIKDEWPGDLFMNAVTAAVEDL